MEKIYIYILIEPITNEVRYVGKTNNIGKRRRYHFNLKTQKNFKTHTSKWLVKILSSGLKPRILVIDSTTNKWEELEQYWIEKLKSLKCNLTNHTVGGGGTSGYKMSKEFCEKQSKLKMGRIVSDKVIEDFKQRIIGNTYGRGENNGRAVLKEGDVIKICELLNNKTRIVDIIKLIPGVTINMVAFIKSGKTWKHISKLHLNL